jgi:Peptidase family S41
MKQLRRIIPAVGAIALLLLANAGRADVTNRPPDFNEVYDLIRSHLAGQSADELNQAAVQGLLDQLHAKVLLVPGKSDTGVAVPGQESPLVQFGVYDGPVACLRVGGITDGLAAKITSVYKMLSETNQFKGIIIDLRFADGHDYDAAVAAANLFISRDVPLLDWGNGPVHSKANKDAITLPLVVLVNHQTADAAEALAAILRDGAQAVILGSTTAGEATIGRNYPLKNGQYLRIATSAVKLGNGDALSASGLKPDIQISVKPEDEKAYYADPFKIIYSPDDLASLGANSAQSTNRVSRPHLTEADLIRERKARPGMELEYGEPAPGEDAASNATDKPTVRDPVLARAVDLVKGISAIRQPRAP